MERTTRTATHDPTLKAKIVARTRLLYAEGPSDHDDRPPHVESASGLATLGEFLFVVQDNANWLAIVHPDESVTAVPLPRGAGGVRLFNDERDNTDEKADLEACVIMQGGEDGPELVAFGSGTGTSSCWVLRVVGVERATAGGPCDAQFLDAGRFYASLKQNRAFSGGRVNIEGAVALDGERILLLQRGNAPPGEGEPVDAIGTLEWPALKAHLDDPDKVPPPRLDEVVRYELGELEGVPLTFSDAELLDDGRILFSASAEASGGKGGPDGTVKGSVLGLIEAGGEARWAPVLDEQGQPFEGKIEGLTLAPTRRGRIRFVIDNDDETAPSEIFEAELGGSFRIQAEGSAASASLAARSAWRNGLVRRGRSGATPSTSA